MNVKYYKKYIEKLINTNPVEIVITRTEATDDGFGGREETEITLEPQIVTFYDAKARREVVSDKGITTGYYSSDVVKILTGGDADMILPQSPWKLKMTAPNASDRIMSSNIQSE